MEEGWPKRSEDGEVGDARGVPEPSKGKPRPKAGLFLTAAPLALVPRKSRRATPAVKVPGLLTAFAALQSVLEGLDEFRLHELNAFGVQPVALSKLEEHLSHVVHGI